MKIDSSKIVSTKLVAAVILFTIFSSCDKENDIDIDVDNNENKMWVQSHSDFIPEALINNIAISSDGGTIAITDWDSNLRTGIVQVYRKNGDEWQQIGESISGNDEDEFGMAISLNGDGSVVAIGAPSYDMRKGSVLIYRYFQDKWETAGQIIGSENWTFLGEDVELNNDGTRIAIISNPLGQFGYDATLSVYEQSGSDWVSIIDNFDDVIASDIPLPSLDFNAQGNRVFLGHTHNTGFVDAYTINGSELVSIGDRIVGENLYDWFGNIATNTNGSTVAIGGIGFPAGNYEGIVKVYQETAGWEQKGSTLTGSEVDEQFGGKVALSGDANRLVVGADIGFNRVMLVQIYDFVDGDWDEALTISRNDVDTSDDNGIETFDHDLKLSEDGNTLIILLGRKMEIWAYE